MQANSLGSVIYGGVQISDIIKGDNKYGRKLKQVSILDAPFHLYGAQNTTT